MLKEEILYLERVNNLIDRQLVHDQNQLEHYMEEIKIIPDDDENKFSMTGKWIDLYMASIASLKRHKDKPYFARIDFKEIDWVLNLKNYGVIEDLRVFLDDIKHDRTQNYHLVYDNSKLMEVIKK